MPRRRSGAPSGSSPSRITPELGVSSPPTIRISVVLPQPDGPRNTMTSPCATSRSKGATTSMPPPGPSKRFVTPSKRR